MGATLKRPRCGSVEADETYIGAEKPAKRGPGAAGNTLALMAAQEDGPGLGPIRLRRIKGASALSLEDAIQMGVEPGSLVHTDGWCG